MRCLRREGHTAELHLEDFLLEGAIVRRGIRGILMASKILFLNWPSFTNARSIVSLTDMVCCEGQARRVGATMNVGWKKAPGQRL